MIIHADLFVASMERSLDFYAGKLGYRIVDDSVVRGGLVRFVSRGHYDAMRLVLLKVSTVGPMIELLEFQADSSLLATDFRPAPHHGSLTVLVSDLTSHVASLAGKGIQPTSEIFTVSMPKVGDSRIVFYEDPDGHMLEFIQMERDRP